MEPEIIGAWVALLSALAEENPSGTKTSKVLPPICLVLGLKADGSNSEDVISELGEPEEWPAIAAEARTALMCSLNLIDISIKLVPTVDGPTFEFYWKRGQSAYGWFRAESFWVGFRKLLKQTKRRKRGRHAKSTQ